ncbi:MAG TPA: hypothetical protein VL961_04370 [Acidimicrobiales bacterium]|nr:hypothetical protein [Acidimicrobiales bacterium]
MHWVRARSAVPGTDPDPTPEGRSPLQRFWVVPGVVASAAFAWFVLWQGTLAGALFWNDSKSYEAQAGLALWSVRFWTSPKPPLVPLVWKLTGSGSGFTAFQSLFAVACWGFLAWTVALFFSHPWWKLTSLLLTLALASSTQVILWNRSILSDSIAVSEVALLVAALWWLTRRVTWVRVMSVLLVCALSAGTRYAQSVTVLGIAAFGAVWAFRERSHRDVFARLAGLALGLGVLCAGSVYEGAASGLTGTEMQHVYAVRVFPFPARVAWFAQHGLPGAGAIDRMARTTPSSPHQAKVVGVALPSVRRWITRHGASEYALWLLVHPLDVITMPLSRPELAFNFSGGDEEAYAALNRSDSPLDVVMWPAWVWLLGVTAIVVYVASGREDVWGDDTWRFSLWLIAIGLVQMLVAWHSDGQETTRHTFEGQLEARVAVLACTLIVLSRHPWRGFSFRSLPRRLRHRSGPGPDGAVSDSAAGVDSGQHHGIGGAQAVLVGGDDLGAPE